MIIFFILTWYYWIIDFPIQFEYHYSQASLLLFFYSNNNNFVIFIVECLFYQKCLLLFHPLLEQLQEIIF